MMFFKSRRALLVAVPLLFFGLTFVQAVAPTELMAIRNRINNSGDGGELPFHKQLRRIEIELNQGGFASGSKPTTDSKSSETLRLEFEILRSADYLSNGALAPRIAPDMALIVDRLVKRGEEIAPLVRALHQSYLQAREFEKANALAARFLDVARLEAIPRYSVASSDLLNKNSSVVKRSVWRLALASADEPASFSATLEGARVDTLVREVSLISSGVHVVAIVSPRCHFSLWAVNAIKRDLELTNMTKSATWLMPPGNTLDVPSVGEWNRANPQFRFDYVHATQEWPELDYWDTPHFYFFVDGRKVATVGGWPREGRKAEMLKAYENAKAALAKN